jgi:RhtB (resistance to homoserine/threonine) family protein
VIKYLSIGIVALLASVSPGPDFAIVARNALSKNRKMAIMTSLGVGTGMLFHATYCILGFAVVIANSIVVYNIIKYLGSGYLIYLGLSNFFSKNNPLPDLRQVSTHSLNPVRAFVDGLLTNSFNPKVTLFMLSIFTVIINANVSRFVQIGCGLEIACITTLWFIFLSVSLTHEYIYRKINAVQHLVNKIIGLILVTMGLVIVLKN